MRRIVPVGFAFILCVIASPVSSQDTEALDRIGREIRTLGESTERVVALLEREAVQRSEEIELRRLQIAVLALQLRSTTISSLVDRIQTLRDRLTESQEVTASQQSELDRIEQIIAENEGTDEGNRTHFESTRRQIERLIELSQAREWTLERQILDLENDLASKRRDVEALEDIVMEGLSEL